MNLRLGRISKIFNPGYSQCNKCRTTWAFVKGHTTWYTGGSGMFPLCEKCWSELTPETRLPHYRSLYESWVAGSYFKDSDGSAWEKIERAVLSEEIVMARTRISESVLKRYYGKSA